MRLRYALITDYANVTGDGKLNLIGVSDRIFAYQFPAVHRELYVINSIETENEDDGTVQPIHVQVIDPDGRTLSEIKGEVQIEGPKQIFNQIHCFRDISFVAPGSYQINIFVNGDKASEMTLELMQITAPAP